MHERSTGRRNREHMGVEQEGHRGVAEIVQDVATGYYRGVQEGTRRGTKGTGVFLRGVGKNEDLCR